MGGAEEDGCAETESFGIGDLTLGGFEVGLIQHQQDGFAEFTQGLGDGSVGREDAGRAIEHKEDEVGLGGGLEGECVEGGLELGQIGLRLVEAAMGLMPLPFPRGFGFAAGLFDTGGVEQPEGAVEEAGGGLADISRGAGGGVGEGFFAAGEHVEQGAFADVGAADDGDLGPCGCGLRGGQAGFWGEIFRFFGHGWGYGG